MELLGLALHYFLSFAIVISVIVFVHEYGHYWVARRCGVKIETFSIGFGPEIFGWTDKAGTRWKLSILPFGGYVKMFGDVGAASTPDNTKLKKMTKAEKEGAFHLKPLWKKAAVVGAGPAANFIFALIVLTGFFLAFGRPETAPVIGSIVKESAAEKAGFQIGDTIQTLNGKSIERFEDIRVIASLNPDTALPYTLNRKGEAVTGSITPKLSATKDIFGNEVKVGLLGITSGSYNYKKLGLSESIIASFKETYTISASTLKAIGQMITGKRSAEDLSGILQIGKLSGQAANQGIITVIWLMALLSINLGLINLFPIPMLDGGHLMYYAVEAVSGRPLAERIQEYGFRLGFVLLMLLMVFATFNDLRRFNVF